MTSPGSDTRIRWCGDSQRVIRGFPADARQNIGNDLQRLDEGGTPLDFDSMGAALPGVYELRDEDGQRWYRALYIQLEGVIWILHCYTKTTNQTSQRDIETARIRLRDLKRQIAAWKKEAKHAERKRS